MYSPNIADLCRAAGVGQTRLHRCFMEIYGTSPAHFIRMKRLSQCRERLLDREFAPPLVKDVALAFGFHEMGRFARYYRETFGELPSETLQRTQAHAIK
jgi:transcriptional regulator GlxA family with amidase domain